MTHVYAHSFYYPDISDSDIPIILKFPHNAGFLVTEKDYSAESERQVSRWQELEEKGGEQAIDQVYLETDEFVPDAVLVTNETKLARMGDVVGGGYFPLLRGSTARLFESFNLGSHVRLVETPVHEPDPDQNGTVEAGPYRLRKRPEEGAWLSLIVTGKQNSISDAQCDPRALLSDSPRNRNGTLWKPVYLDEGSMKFEPGLAFDLSSLGDVHIWKELRVSRNLYYMSPDLGKKFAELVADYPAGKRVFFDPILRYPVVEG